MKKDILKIAGVKSEKEFYKLFPSEEAFMKVHGKAFEKAKMGKSMVKKQLTQLTDFSNPPQAQSGISALGNPTMTKILGKGLSKSVNPLGTALGAATDVIKGIQMLQQQKQELQEAKQMKALSDVTKQAASIRPEQTRRKYERPEDNLVQPGQLTNPYGTGYDVLGMAENGMQIGGNLTELQNMYNPGDIYSNLGYEPLDESSKIKQFTIGGDIAKQFQGIANQAKGFFNDWQNNVQQMGPDKMGSYGQFIGGMLGGSKGRITGASQIGKGVGTAAGSLFGPLGAAVGSGLGSLVGGLVGGQRERKIAEMQDEAYQNLQEGAFQQGVQNTQNQYASFMEHGGWVSHDWQPQVIAKFGNYDVKDLLAPPKDADMLRAGGHLKEYTAPSQRAMSTERPQFAMGGELNTHWGGDTELISYNPYMPGSGETRIASGLYHSQSDGKGNTGIGMSYGSNMVEVENGEPIIEMQEGGQMSDDKSAVVFGNLKIPSYVASELDGAKNKMFKTYINELSKEEAEQNKIMDRATKLINNIDGDTPFDLLSLNTGKAMLQGADMGLKKIAYNKKIAATAQNAMHEAADEFGFDVEKFANNNKIVQAKAGGKFSSAQNGQGVLKDYQNPNVDYSAAARFAKFAPYEGYEAKKLQANLPTPEFMQPVDFDKPLYTPAGLPELQGLIPSDIYERTGYVPEELSFKSEFYNTPKKSDGKKKEDSSDNKLTFDMLQSALYPLVKPVNQSRLSPEQLMGEMYALQSNVLEPVQAQTYQPLLETEPAAVATAQSQLNEITASANAARRLAGNNPAAQAMISSQEYTAKNNILGQQMAANIQAKEAARQRNLAALNDKTLKNLAIYDQQYQRQAQAKALTKATAQAALNSIASKIGQNKLENLTAGVMGNMYNYVFDKSGRAINVNPLFQPAIPNVTEKKTTGKNGGIVKAIKNL